MSKFELRLKRDFGSNTLIKTDSIEEIAAFAAEKSGEENLEDILEA